MHVLFWALLFWSFSALFFTTLTHAHAHHTHACPLRTNTSISQPNLPTQAALQTKLFEINILVVEGIFAAELFSHYDHPRIAHLCEKVGLLQRALQPSDVVMVADVDEVPRRAFARSLRLCAVPLPAKMSMVFFYYSLRCRPCQPTPRAAASS